MKNKKKNEFIDYMVISYGNLDYDSVIVYSDKKRFLESVLYHYSSFDLCNYKYLYCKINDFVLIDLKEGVKND